MKFNINEYVSVRLTPEGLEVREQYFRQYDIFDEPEVDSEGYTRFSLWCLMAIFGEHLYNGEASMFETDILIHVPEE